MKRKFAVAILFAAVAVAFYFALRLLIPGDHENNKLAIPSEVRISSYTLIWETVRSADRYEVEIDGCVRTSLTDKMDLKYSDAGKPARVRALGKGYSPSDYTEAFVISFSQETLNNKVVTYALPREDELLEMTGVLTREFNYDGTPISVDAADLSAYGYNFNFWYSFIGGVKEARTMPFVHGGSITLFADCTPIDYKVEYVCDEMELPKDLPETVNADTFAALQGIEVSSRGYRVSGWRVGSATGAYLSETEFFPHDITLYAEVSLCCEGLVFAECEGGYALEGYFGENETVEIPSSYRGRKVVKVRKNALEGVRRVMFYGDIYLESDAIGNCPFLEEVVFYGAAEGAEGSVRWLCGVLGAVTSACFYGQIPKETAFIAGYLDFSPKGGVQISVRQEFYEEAKITFEGFNVTVL